MKRQRAQRHRREPHPALRIPARPIEVRFDRAEDMRGILGGLHDLWAVGARLVDAHDQALTLQQVYAILRYRQ